MAEGHAVARWGDALRDLVGERVLDIAVPPRWRDRAEHIRGTQLVRVQTHGKHLVLHFSNGWVIHTHAMQYGSWQVGPIGQALRKDARYARLRLTTERHDVLFYHRYERWMRNWVYRRRGQPCFVCATPIEMVRQGEFQRTTYFCSHCQPEASNDPRSPGAGGDPPQPP
jgi:formamidopyrimidine-DNA glycosylase